MSFACHNAQSLIPSYTDGELSEEQAAPLRRHLLECLACREVTQGEQALKRWFAPTGDALAKAPQGFAARVARRAFAGDQGLLAEEPAAAEPREGAIYTFVLQLTAVAAAVLLVFSLAIRGERLPADSGLMADENYTQTLEELERLNAREAEAARADEEEAGTAEPGR